MQTVTQKEMARLLGMSAPTLKKYEDLGVIARVPGMVCRYDPEQVERAMRRWKGQSTELDVRDLERKNTQLLAENRQLRDVLKQVGKLARLDGLA